MEEQGIRLNKYLSAAGVCSRREADRLIAAGEVTVDGRTAVTGERVLEGQIVVCQGRMVGSRPQSIILMFNKPPGIVCTADKREKDNIVDYIRYPQRVYPVGRLDKASRGLILMTNRGEMADRLLRSANYHEKEYVVRVNQPLTASFLQQMSAGVYLSELQRTTRKCRVYKIDVHTFGIVLTQGWNRQIRRMCETFGYRVRDLQRIRIMDLTLQDLREGEYRPLTVQEERALMDALFREKSKVRITEYGD